jgi:hypothetical protein
MGWVREEYEDRVRSRQPGDASGTERQFEEAAARRWDELVSQIETDVNEYRQNGGKAEFTRVSESEVHVSDSESALAVTVWADVVGHTIHYEFTSSNERVAAPEGGIFSIRLSNRGRTDLFSADQRVHSEEARRMLLEPVIFPTEMAA